MVWIVPSALRRSKFRGFKIGFSSRNDREFVNLLMLGGKATPAPGLNTFEGLGIAFKRAAAEKNSAHVFQVTALLAMSGLIDRPPHF